MTREPRKHVSIERERRIAIVRFDRCDGKNQAEFVRMGSGAS
jgi:hypothetical protein